MPTLMDAWPALALMGLLILLPWGVTWLRRRGWQGAASRGQVLKLVGAVAVGPQQKVVTIEVTQGDRRKWLVLGVTPQAINRLDILDVMDAPDVPGNTAQESPPSFQSVLSQQTPPAP
jgi:flagellar protein FliO/FliZ